MNFFDNFKNKNLIIAHRGFKNIKLENSLEAFEYSLKKCDLVEFDVQFTKDYVAILHHDNDFNFEDKKVEIADTLYKDIQNMKKNILSLESFFVFAKESKLFFNLEIKDINNKLDENICIEKTLELLEKYQLIQKVLISAFNHEYLKKIKNLNKNIATAALDEKSRAETINYLKDLNVEAYNINKKLVTKELIKNLKKENIETLVYTVNQKKKIKELFELGVKGIFTDKPYEESKTR